MFTVLAILFTVFGVPLLASGPKSKTISPANRLGGFLCAIAFVLWMCVLISLIYAGLSWLWEHAP